MITKFFKWSSSTFIAATALSIGFLLSPQERGTAQTSSPVCQPVNTRLDGTVAPCLESPIGFCANGTVQAGLLKGSKEAVYIGISPTAGMPGVEPESTLSYSATQVFHTEHGDLHMSVIGVSDYAQLVFTEIARITGGTGRFANATGNLFISGQFSSDAVSFVSEVTGEICWR